MSNLFNASEGDQLLAICMAQLVEDNLGLELEKERVLFQVALAKVESTKLELEQQKSKNNELLLKIKKLELAQFENSDSRADKEQMITNSGRSAQTSSKNHPPSNGYMPLDDDTNQQELHDNIPSKTQAEDMQEVHTPISNKSGLVYAEWDGRKDVWANEHNAWDEDEPMTNAWA